MAFTPAKWPGRVIPADKDQAEVATRSLFVRCQWRDPVTKEAKAILQRWYDAWWCVDALVVGLERKPGKSGERQPRRGDKESVEKFLLSRLREWFDDEADEQRGAQLPPPRTGMGLEMWAKLRKKQDTDAGLGRRRRPLSEAGQRARDLARQQARQGRPDPIAKMRERDRRIEQAMDMIGPMPIVVANDKRSEPDGARESQLVAAYAARTATIEHDPTVHRIVQRVAAENRRPTKQERTILARAIRGARQRASLGTLEATTADAINAVLSESAQRILTYLDYAANYGLTLDQTLALMHAQVEAATKY